MPQKIMLVNIIIVALQFDDFFPCTQIVFLGLVFFCFTTVKLYCNVQV